MESLELPKLKVLLFLTIIIGAAVLGSFFASPIILRRVAIHGDIGMHFLPVKALYAERLKAGEYLTGCNNYFVDIF